MDSAITSIHHNLRGDPRNLRDPRDACHRPRQLRCCEICRDGVRSLRAGAFRRGARARACGPWVGEKQTIRKKATEKNSLSSLRSNTRGERQQYEILQDSVNETTILYWASELNSLLHVFCPNTGETGPYVFIFGK